MSNLVVQCWTEERFLASGDEWQRLLARSDSDPLFLSWDWQTQWWLHHSRRFALSLQLLAVYTPGGELCALAPLHARRTSYRLGIRSTRLELIGSVWRASDAVFSEYLDIIVARGMEQAALAALTSWLRADRFWDELVLAYVREDSLARRLLSQGLEDRVYVRASDAMVAWQTALPDSFEAFLRELAPTTRRRLFNQRSKLTAPVFHCVPAEQAAASLERLEQFASQRWGVPPQPQRVHFHAALVRSVAARGGLRLTELRSADTCISVMLNFRLGSTEYYLQSGFDPDHAHGCSPGYLHLGYAIEAACRDAVRTFDFLGGGGMQRDYKRDFLTQPLPLTSYQGIRSKLLRFALSAYDRVSRFPTAE